MPTVGNRSPRWHVRQCVVVLLRCRPAEPQFQGRGHFVGCVLRCRQLRDRTRFLMRPRTLRGCRWLRPVGHGWLALARFGGPCGAWLAVLLLPPRCNRGVLELVPFLLSLRTWCVRAGCMLSLGRYVVDSGSAQDDELIAGGTYSPIRQVIAHGSIDQLLCMGNRRLLFGGCRHLY